MSGLLAALLWLCYQLVDASVVVKCKSGKLAGSVGLSRDGREFLSFTRVPFAKPPVGALRLANPLPYGRWDGLYDATQPAPHCVQTKWTQLPPLVTGAEDCLYLNIFRPKEPGDSLPVIVSIYGGGFCGGGIKSKDFVSYWMDENVVFVEMNYRTGLLGFMSLGDTVIPGNFGLKDQALALDWVKANIADFGGDPDSITLLGASAGAASAHHLTLAPSTRGKIRGAVLLSGSVNKVWSLMDSTTAKNRALNSARFIGCNQTSSHDILVCLRKLDAKVLPLTNQLYPLAIPFGPVVEATDPQALITQDPRGFNSTTPLVIAFANGERSILLRGILENLGVKELLKNPDVYVSNILTLNLTCNGDHNRKLREIIYSKYFEPSVTSMVDAFGLMFEDSSHTFPPLDTLRRHLGAKFVARFECNEKDVRKAALHGSGYGFIFNTTSIGKTSELYALSKKYIKMIANFARFQ